MKASNFGRIFIILSCVAALSACNKNKDTWANRKYQDMVARYNVYFNGVQRLQEATAALEKSHVDDYKKILEVYPYGTEDNRKSQAAQMDEIIKKASKVIADRPLSKWVDDAYLLMGKAYFFKADHFAAVETFQFINSQYKGSEMSYEATLWIIKCYVYLGKSNEAEAIIGLLKNDPAFPKKHQDFFNEVSALVYIKQSKYAVAIEKMELAVKAAKGSSKKARFHYILGQLHEKQKNRADARYHYRMVTKGNPPYEMAFNAKVNLARNYNPDNKNEVRSARKYLRGMLKDDKNLSFFDQIYYELGLLEKNENNPEKAIEYFKLSNENNSVNSDQKALSYLALADIYFNRPDYVNAQLYYDSAVYFIKPEFENYAQLKAKQEVLSELIKNLILIQKEDSLLNVAKMPRKDIDALVDKTIREEKQREELRKKEEDKKKKEGLTNRPVLPNNPAPAPVPTPGSSPTGVFYFNDPANIARGYNEFISKWGQRKNVDNWRYNSIASKQINEEDPEKEDPGKPPVKKDESPESNLQGVEPDKQKYYKDIPFSEEAKNSALERIAAAYLSVGVIYFEQLKEYNDASAQFEQFVTRFPQHPEMPKALFYLHKIKLAQNNIPESDKYKARLMSKYPESKYAQFLSNTAVQEDETSKLDKEVVDLYANAYNAYKNKQYPSFFELKKRNDQKYFGSTLQPKYELLAALAYADMDSFRLAEITLENLMGNYPTSPEALTANKILNAYKKHKSESKMPDPAIPGKTVAYKFNPDSKHYFIFMIPVENTKVNTNMIRAKFTDFNTAYQSDRTFSVENLMAGKQQFVMVKEFANSDEALKYLQLVQANKEFLKSLGLTGYDLMVADPKNMGLMVVNADADGYRLFFNEYYTK